MRMFFFFFFFLNGRVVLVKYALGVQQPIMEVTPEVLFVCVWGGGMMGYSLFEGPIPQSHQICLIFFGI